MKTITTRTRLALVAGTLALAAVAAGANGQKFYPDDPIARIVDSQDASGVQDGRSTSRHAREPVLLARDRTPNVRAQNLNTIDEVPDSNWFTNRLGPYPSRSTNSSKVRRPAPDRRRAAGR